MRFRQQLDAHLSRSIVRLHRLSRLTAFVWAIVAVTFFLAVQQSGDGVALDVCLFVQRVRSLGARRVAGDFIALFCSELSNQLQTVSFTGSSYPLPCDELIGRCRRCFYCLSLAFGKRLVLVSGICHTFVLIGDRSFFALAALHHRYRVQFALDSCLRRIAVLGRSAVRRLSLPFAALQMTARQGDVLGQTAQLFRPLNTLSRSLA